MLDAGAVHILQAEVTRCGGIINMLRVDGLCKARNLPFSAHCAPAISAHACCGMEAVVHIEYFFDHYRIESRCSTARPTLTRLRRDLFERRVRDRGGRRETRATRDHGDVEVVRSARSHITALPLGPPRGAHGEPLVRALTAA
jgi:L-alanine-DL-glutamate epimerase-like enolase superfamily enzyme